MESTIIREYWDNEEELQAACYRWFHNEYHGWRKMLFHVPNGGFRDKREANKFKAMGLQPGVSDFILILFFAVEFIEMKLPNGTQSDEQKLFQEMVEARGHKYTILRSLKSFKEYIWNTIGK